MEFLTGSTIDFVVIIPQHKACLISQPNLLQMRGQVLQAGQVMDGQEIIHVREGGLDAARKGFVDRGTEERVEPDQAVAGTVQASHFFGQQFGVAAVPAVADDENDRAASQNTPAPIVVEGFEGVAGARAACPVMHDIRDFVEGLVHVFVLELAGDAGETGAEDKGFDRLVVRLGEAIDEMEEQAGVAFHRTANVGDDDQRAGLELGFAGRPDHDFAAGFVALAEGTAEVGALALPGAEAARAAFAHLQGEFAHHSLYGVEFFPGEIGKVFAAENFAVGIGAGDDQNRLLFA